MIATISVTAPDISCAHCQATIERELSTLSGVRSVSVEVPTRRVTVVYDPAAVTEAQIVEKLDEEGYPAAS